MPVKMPDDLPARSVLEQENVSTISESTAFHQDIRPLQIVIANIMPQKSITETQILRLLSNSPLQIDVTFLHPESHNSKNTPPEYLRRFYKMFSDVKDQRFDGLIVTGAPIETIDFDQVGYWSELCQLMEWSKHNVYSTLHLCWGAQAGLYHHYGVPKHMLDKKMFGVFEHHVQERNSPLLHGFDDVFMVPHSRRTTTIREDVLKVPELAILAESDDAGVYLVSAQNGRQVFVSGHPEYDPLTLKTEYDRDIGKGLSIDAPRNYFPDDNPENPPRVTWRGHANLLYSNWLNNIYQETPFDLADLDLIDG